jgi:hypothetical protein
MVNSSPDENLSLWGVLHDGELQRVESDPLRQTAALEIWVSHLALFYDWPEGSRIRIEFAGVTGLKVNKWIPQPGVAQENLGARRYAPKQWTELESEIPPKAIDIYEASVLRTAYGCRMELAGHEMLDRRSTDVWLEVLVQAEDVEVHTPEGKVDLERLIQIGDAYWDNFGKKRRR